MLDLLFANAFKCLMYMHIRLNLLWLCHVSCVKPKGPKLKAFLVQFVQFVKTLYFLLETNLVGEYHCSTCMSWCFLQILSIFVLNVSFTFCKCLWMSQVQTRAQFRRAALLKQKKPLLSKIRLPAKTPLNCYATWTTAKYQSQSMYMS